MFWAFLKEHIKKDFGFENTKFKYTIFQMLIIGILIFLSIFWKYFAVIALGCSIFFAIKNLSGRSVYFLIFLLPLMSIFKIETTGSYLLTVLVAVIVFALGIRLLIDVVNKKKKINWTFTSLYVILIIYFSLPFTFPSLSIWGSLVLGTTLLFVAYYYWNDIDLKELIFVFALGTLFSVCIGLFRPISVRLQDMVGLFYAEGYKRFGASAGNVNVFAGELMILFSLFTFLFINKQISILYYPIYFLSSLLLILTMSKSALIIFICINVYLITMLFIKFNKRSMLVILSLIIMSYGLAFMIVPERNCVYWNRLINPIVNMFGNDSEIASNDEDSLIDKDSLNNEDDNSQDCQEIIADEDPISDLTTGRSEIWKQYIKKTFESPKTILFGCGVGAANVGEYNGMTEFSSHNTVIQCFYYVGVIGILLMITWLLSAFNIFNKENFKRIKWDSIIVPISVVLFLCGADFFSYRLSNYLILVCMCLIDKRKKVYDKVVDAGKCEDVSLTILTPTYNRENTLPRLYESLCNQINKNFDWLIVDDGSRDGTKKLVESFKREEKIKIRYIEKENGGKHTALNIGIAQVNSDFCLVVDSDDCLTSDAVETILNDCSKILSDKEIAGVSYLKADLEVNPIGRLFTHDGVIDNFTNERYNNSVWGDKAEVFKTEVLKQYPFPVFEGENFLSESTIWCAISEKYKMQFFNKVVYLCEYQIGGLSDNVRQRLFGNPQGACECYRVMSGKQFNFINKIKHLILYVCHGLQAGKSKQELKAGVDCKFLFSIMYLPGKMLFNKRKKIYG